jgi:uncharacterized protein involved in exopolysaccharide biosynthesis
MTDQDSVRFQDIITPVWLNRKPIAVLTFLVTLLTIIVNYGFLPHYFKATATLLPETEKGKLSGFSQFADVAKLTGVSIPGSEIARLYPSIVMSETILRSVIEKRYYSVRLNDSVNLLSYFEQTKGMPDENMYESLDIMKGLLTASVDGKTSIVALSLEMKEPVLAAAVLNEIVRQLDEFIRTKKITNATEQRKWIDQRLKEVEVELRNAEEALKNFREKNRIVEGSPQLRLIQERLGREVQVKTTVFVELKRQYELARIEEIKNVTVVNILDGATPPVKKSRPQRVVNTGLFFLFSLLGSSAYFSVRSLYGERIRTFVRTLRG